MGFCFVRFHWPTLTIPSSFHFRQDRGDRSWPMLWSIRQRVMATCAPSRPPRCSGPPWPAHLAAGSTPNSHGRLACGRHHRSTDHGCRSQRRGSRRDASGCQVSRQYGRLDAARRWPVLPVARLCSAGSRGNHRTGSRRSSTARCTLHFRYCLVTAAPGVGAGGRIDTHQRFGPASRNWHPDVTWRRLSANRLAVRRRVVLAGWSSVGRLAPTPSALIPSAWRP